MRDRDVIWALCRGALAFQDRGAAPAPWVSAAYAAVYHPLRGRTARPADEDFNPLAVAMVGRANVYLRLTHEGARSGEHGRAGSSPIGLGRPTSTAGVTRRELVDLGHPRGKSVKGRREDKAILTAEKPETTDVLTFESVAGAHGDLILEVAGNYQLQQPDGTFMQPREPGTFRFRIPQAVWSAPAPPAE